MSRRSGNSRRNQLVRLVVRDGDRCHWCLHVFDADHPVTLEHLVPVCYGGSRADENTVLACAGCNNTRHHIVRCAACDNRIRRFRTVVWIDRRFAYHGQCLTRTGELSGASLTAQPAGKERAVA